MLLPLGLLQKVRHGHPEEALEVRLGEVLLPPRRIHICRSTSLGKWDCSRAIGGQHEPSHLGLLSTHHDCTSWPLDPHTFLHLASPLSGSGCLCHPCDDLRIMPGTWHQRMPKEHGTMESCICRILDSFHCVSSQLISDDAIQKGWHPMRWSFFFSGFSLSFLPLHVSIYSLGAISCVFRHGLSTTIFLSPSEARVRCRKCPPSICHRLSSPLRSAASWHQARPGLSVDPRDDPPGTPMRGWLMLGNVSLFMCILYSSFGLVLVTS